jgi:hypothetical protein
MQLLFVFLDPPLRGLAYYLISKYYSVNNSVSELHLALHLSQVASACQVSVLVISDYDMVL